MLAAFMRAAGIGLTAGILPGPLQAYLLLQTLRHGIRYSKWLVLGPLLSDLPIIAIVLLVLGQAHENLLRGISFVGGCFILFIAWGVWKQIKAGGLALGVEDDGVEGVVPPSIWTSLRQALVINTLSPGPWLFWGTVNGPLLVAAWRKTPINGLAFLVGFYAVFLGVLMAQVVIFQQARNMGPKMIKVLLRVGLVLLIIFALLLWRQAFS